MLNVPVDRSEVWHGSVLSALAAAGVVFSFPGMLNILLGYGLGLLLINFLRSR